MTSESWPRFGFLSEPDDDEDDEEETSADSEGGWIQWFCRLEGHEFFCEVDEEYIRDAFNLYGLKSKLENFDKAMEMVLGVELPDEEDLMESEIMDLYRDATDLYGLIHARFILSPKGLQQMKEKYLQCCFGACPRVGCNKQRVLPVGLSDELRTHRVRVYCTKCQECYEARGTGIDGAFFGTSFPAIFLQTYPSFVSLEIPQPFFPKIFGFKIHGKRSTIQIKLEKGEYGLEVAEEFARRSTIDQSTLPATSATSDGSKRRGGGSKGSIKSTPIDPKIRGFASSTSVVQSSESPQPFGSRPPSP